MASKSAVHLVVTQEIFGGCGGHGDGGRGSERKTKEDGGCLNKTLGTQHSPGNECECERDKGSVGGGSF